MSVSDFRLYVVEDAILTDKQVMRFKYFSCLAASVVKQWSSQHTRTNVTHCSWQTLDGYLDMDASRVHMNLTCQYTC